MAFLRAHSGASAAVWGASHNAWPGHRHGDASDNNGNRMNVRMGQKNVIGRRPNLKGAIFNLQRPTGKQEGSYVTALDFTQPRKKVV